MIVRVVAASLVIVAGIVACTAAPPESPEPADEAQQDTMDDLTSTTEAASLVQPEDLAAACTGNIACPAQFNNCVFVGDIDCGEEFCRTPGAQCNAEPSTFIRVEHVLQCFDAAGNSCVSIEQGRRLVHCGC